MSHTGVHADAQDIQGQPAVRFNAVDPDDLASDQLAQIMKAVGAFAEDLNKIVARAGRIVGKRRIRHMQAPFGDLFEPPVAAAGIKTQRTAGVHICRPLDQRNRMARRGGNLNFVINRRAHRCRADLSRFRNLMCRTAYWMF